jgi:hypothetical protein
VGGKHRPWCAPCASLGGEKEKGGMGFARQGGARAVVPEKKRKKTGGPVRGRGRKSRADKCAGERGVYGARERGECGAMPRPHKHGTRGPRH